MRAVIDRIEGKLVVVEIKGKIAFLKQADIPADAREGDILIKKGKKWIIDKLATENEKSIIEHIASEIWEE